MSLTAEQLQFMLDHGLSLADAVEFARLAAPSPTLTKGAERTRRWRENKARDVTVTSHVTGHGDVSHVGEPARVVTLSSSLRSEGIPPEKPSVSTPKGAKPRKVTRKICPDNWSPSPKVLADLTADGFTPGEIERELAIFRDHEFADPKSDFDRTFRKWVRTSRTLRPRQAHERSHPDAKFDARQANLARALAGADSAARRQWEP